MVPQPDIPSLDRLIEDLRLLRAPGLLQLRRVPVDALYRAALHCGFAYAPDGESDKPAGIEALLHAAADRLGSDNLGTAARYTFGLVEGTRAWAGQDRRRAAANVYSVGTDRFRKHYEKLAMEQLAERILDICRSTAPRTGNAVAAGGESAQEEPPAPAATPVQASVDPVVPGQRLVVDTVIGVMRVCVTVHVLPVELLTGVDVIVSSENTYLEMSKTFHRTVSGSLRRAAASRGLSGEIVDDVLARELAEWLGKNGRAGLPVLPGTVVATSAGELASQGIRRIYHAAAAVPRSSGSGYEVSPDVIASAVRNVFSVASRERQAFDPPLRSVCFPLLGAGHGGLTAETSIAWVWWSIRQALAAPPVPVSGNGSSPPGDWEIHLVTRRASHVGLIRRALSEGTPGVLP